MAHPENQTHQLRLGLEPEPRLRRQNQAVLKHHRQRQDGFGHIVTWTRNGDGSFVAPQGYFSRLVQRNDGTYVLREPHGLKHFYRPDGRLFCLEDRNGNRMLFAYDAAGNLDLAIDVFGREIDYQFRTFPDGADRLERVVDFLGREIVYTYDANYDLVEVRSPVS